jgi:hypothetical protein
LNESSLIGERPLETNYSRSGLVCGPLAVLTQELIRHTEVELVADTVLIEVEGVIAIWECDARDEMSRPRVLGNSAHYKDPPELLDIRFDGRLDSVAPKPQRNSSRIPSLDSLSSKTSTYASLVVPRSSSFSSISP